ncbi:thioredoxin [Oricola cellulosilytica]|uniref:Thioredoxin n=1 Tax=Oricola cellulosilytica TaxID=1429082 RepID=A0A4R0PDQ8_9HYPH|nr:thioredoxin [Oricola cellulosilytica]TCD15905.1 thioredoxin [Oricola cellulosilytica]
MSASDNPFAPNSASGEYGAQTVGLAEERQAPAAPRPDGLLGGPLAGGDLIKDTTTANFQADVIAESRNQPVLVDFWAPWCGPCKQLTPKLEDAVRKAGGKVKLVKMNIDDHPSIPGQMGVQSIPAVIAFHNGQPVDGFMGAVPDSQLQEFIGKLAGAAGGAQEEALKQALEAAGTAREAGDTNRAAQIYSMVLDQMPENAAAYAGLAGMLFDAGQADDARAMVEQAPEAVARSPELASVQARIDLAEKVADIGDPAALEKRLADNPKDHDAKFDLAQIRNATGEHEAAAELLLEIMRDDREWRDDGARKELLMFFEAWGPADPATAHARRKLSSMLFR